MTEYERKKVVMAQMRKRKGKFQFIVNKTGYPTLYKTFINKSTGSQWAREVELQMENTNKILKRILYSLSFCLFVVISDKRQSIWCL